MKKQIKTGIQLFLCLLISIHVFPQSETFDIITYTPPKDWKKEAKPGVVNYTNVNTTTGVFCVIAMYASRTSAGDVQKDFDNQWKELAVTPFKAEANPQKETQTADGWEIVSASANVKLDETDISITLTVISGFGKTVSIRASMNDQSYAAELNTLFESMELDKTKTSIVNNNNTTPVQTSEAGGKFGQMIYITPAGWSEKIPECC